MKKLLLSVFLVLFANANAIIKDGNYEIQSLVDKKINSVLAGGNRYNFIINKDEFELNTKCNMFYGKIKQNDGLLILDEVKQNTYMCSKTAKANEEFILKTLKEFKIRNCEFLENEEIKINLKDLVVYKNYDEKVISEFKDKLLKLYNISNIDMSNGKLLSKGEFLQAIKYKNSLFKAPNEKAWGIVIKNDEFTIFVGCNLIYGKLTQAKNGDRYTNEFSFSDIKSTSLKCKSSKLENILKTNLKTLKEQRNDFFSKDLILYYE